MQSSVASVAGSQSPPRALSESSGGIGADAAAYWGAILGEHPEVVDMIKRALSGISFDDEAPLTADKIRELERAFRHGQAALFGVAPGSDADIFWEPDHAAVLERVRKFAAERPQLAELGCAVGLLEAMAGNGAFTHIGAGLAVYAEREAPAQAALLQAHESAHLAQHAVLAQLLAQQGSSWAELNRALELMTAGDVSALSESGEVILAVIEGQAQVAGAALLAVCAGWFPNQREALLFLAVQSGNLWPQMQAKAWPPLPPKTEFIYSEGAAFVHAVIEKTGQAGWTKMLYDPPNRSQVLRPELYLRGEKPPEPQPIGLAKHIPDATPLAWQPCLGPAIWRSELGDMAAEGWLAERYERVKVSGQHAHAEAISLLFETAEQANAFATALAATGNPRRRVVTRHEDNRVWAVICCPEHLEETVLEAARKSLAPT